MKTTKHLLFWLACICFFSSCGDKEDDPTPTENAGSLDYYPTTAGSTWTYEGVNNYSMTALGTKKVINNKSYHELEQKQGTTVYKNYLLKENGAYSSISQDPRAPGAEITILKENEPLGASWFSSIVLNGITQKYKFTMVAKGLTKKVAGKEFKNVINVKLESSVVMNGTEYPVPLVTNYYFAKGVGLILTDLGAGNAVTLKSYSIK